MWFGFSLISWLVIHRQYNLFVEERQNWTKIVSRNVWMASMTFPRRHEAYIFLAHFFGMNMWHFTTGLLNNLTPKLQLIQFPFIAILIRAFILLHIGQSIKKKKHFLQKKMFRSPTVWSSWRYAQSSMSPILDVVCKNLSQI